MKKQILRSSLSILGISLFSFLFIYSDTPKSTQVEVPVKIATFTYKPDSLSLPKSQKIGFILISPRYAEEFAFKSYHPFSDFAKAMTNDVNGVIVARGYSIFGPYSTIDEMVLSDKKAADIILYVEIAPELNWQNVHLITHYDYKAQSNTYKFSGTLNLKGKVNISARSIWGGQQLLWTQSIPIEEREIPINSLKSYALNGQAQPFIVSDAGVVNPVVEALESQYTSIMKLIYSHLDPEQMKAVKLMADDLKKNDPIGGK